MAPRIRVLREALFWGKTPRLIWVKRLEDDWGRATRVSELRAPGKLEGPNGVCHPELLGTSLWPDSSLWCRDFLEHGMK